LLDSLLQEMIKLFFLCFFALLPVLFGCNIEDDFASAQEMLDCYVERYRMVGADIGLIVGEDFAVRAYSGVRVFNDSTPIGSEDMYIMGSSGKSITSTLCARVVAQGFIRWNSTTKEIFQDTGLIKVHPGYFDSTLEQFVSHGSGAPGLDGLLIDHNDMVDYLFETTNWDQDFDQRPARLELTRSILEAPPRVQPGTFEYSIGGFSIAAAMLEQATGRSFEELLRTEVFEPLGMEGCGFGPTTLNPDLPSEQPWGHLSNAEATHINPIVPGDFANIGSAMVPDGGLHCNLNSWKNYIVKHMNEDEDFLPKDQWEWIHHPVTQGYYGFGWFFDYSQMGTIGPVFQHGGTDGHNFAQAVIVPRFNIGLIMGTNTAGVMIPGSRQGVGFQQVSTWVFEHAFGKEKGGQIMQSIRKNHGNKMNLL